MNHIYEINTATWLYRLQQKYQQPLTLSSVPDAELNILTDHHIDTVWLMGIWQRSPLAIEQCKKDEALLHYFPSVLPDFAFDDIIGSPYAIKAYEIDQRFGTRADLANLRERLAARHIKLILDFVPNHTALDHEWVTEHSDYYITSTTDQPGFYRRDQTIVAHGKDPYFSPWQDTAQLNPYSSGYRQASTRTLLDLATMCDGVRCDMAMLLLNDVAKKTWGDYLAQPPTTEYWSDVIAAVQTLWPSFTFIAECYWSTEPKLLELGFTYCYDKPLYDKLRANDHDGAKALVASRGAMNQQLIHFIENHDEDRAASSFTPENEQQSARYLTTIPGACLWHDGQFEGNKIKASVHLRRRANEPVNQDIWQFYASLL